MLERAKEATRYGEYTGIEYARFADDLVILIDAHPRHDWLPAVEKRLREELAALQAKSTKRRVGSWIWTAARASAFWGSTSAASAVDGAYGVRSSRRSGAAAEAQGDIPPPPIPTSEPGGRVDWKRRHHSKSATRHRPSRHFET